jgi:hypothetical protein
MRSDSRYASRSGRSRGREGVVCAHVCLSNVGGAPLATAARRRRRRPVVAQQRNNNNNSSTSHKGSWCAGGRPRADWGSSAAPVIAITTAVYSAIPCARAGCGSCGPPPLIWSSTVTKVSSHARLRESLPFP